jgi:hypothetical protein
MPAGRERRDDIPTGPWTDWSGPGAEVKTDGLIQTPADHEAGRLPGPGEGPSTRQHDRLTRAHRASHTTYIVRRGDLTVLADALSKHFKGQAAVSVLPSGEGSTLLISGAPGAAAELAKLLE